MSQEPLCLMDSCSSRFIGISSAQLCQSREQGIVVAVAFCRTSEADMYYFVLFLLLMLHRLGTGARRENVKAGTHLLHPKKAISFYRYHKRHDYAKKYAAKWMGRSAFYVHYLYIWLRTWLCEMMGYLTLSGLVLTAPCPPWSYVNISS